MTWEQRFHPLRQEWVIVAGHRQERPWSGELVAGERPRLPSHQSDCYLCPGNRRVGGHQNPAYSGVFVFDNDLPCVGEAAPRVVSSEQAPLLASPAAGVARVVCYTPRHDRTLAESSLAELLALLHVWQEQYRELGARPDVKHVLVFENKGEVVGVSNPHPHGQIYATGFVPKTTEIEVTASERHFAETGRSLLADVIDAERRHGARTVYEDEHAVSFLPFFARYPYEAFVAPKRAYPSLAALSAPELEGFARALLDLLVRYDNLWRMSFPYVLVLHQAPTDESDHPGFHFHAEVHPPLRKPNLRKYLAGPEIGAGLYLLDAAPEDKAAELRAVPATHYGSLA